MRIVRQRQPSVALDMSPLIDCVFQLLIFFLLSSTYLAPSTRLELPRAASTDEPEAPEILLTIDRQGHFYLNASPINPAELQTELTRIVGASRRRTVTIRGDHEMQYKWFVHALEAAQASGAAHLDLLHDPVPPRRGQ